jgi:hypothetical protein
MVADIYAEARSAANAAAIESNSKLPSNQSARGFDCGFAWVTVKPARGPFVAWCKANGKGRSGSFSGGPGYGFWYGDLHDVPTQLVSVHEAACRAFAEVLEKHGLNASWSSRLD